MDKLEELQANRRKRRNLADKIAYVDEELADLVRQAFAAGYTGPEISVAANLSKARVYQIRDGRR